MKTAYKSEVQMQCYLSFHFVILWIEGIWLQFRLMSNLDVLIWAYLIFLRIIWLSDSNGSFKVSSSAA